MMEIREMSDAEFLDKLKQRLAPGIEEGVDKYILTKDTVLRLIQICDAVTNYEDDGK